MIEINKVYISKTSKYKIVEVLDCGNNPCYHIKLRLRGILRQWNDLRLHYTLDEAKIVIPRLIELDKDETRTWFWWLF
jgi:hypothetical protein